jgi:hypothetical protein
VSPVPDAGAAPAPPGLDVPRTSFPENESVFRGEAKVRVDLAWLPVDQATGYLLEVEERTADTWTRILGRVVTDAKASVEIEPIDPRHGDYRWRVRSVVGRKGGRASPWWLFKVR